MHNDTDAEMKNELLTEIDKGILSKAKELVALLENPEPGLYTWHSMLVVMGRELRDRLNEVIK